MRLLGYRSQIWAIAASKSGINIEFTLPGTPLDLQLGFCGSELVPAAGPRRGLRWLEP